jgi:hypothetical protein|tara:strand:+ start:277 stop:705 length:429 start_codon:yes stop_codon:yes gene_type:complete
MTIQYVSDVEFGSELPATQPDTSLKASSAFAKAVGYAGSGRFEDHEKAREQGLPGALVPGIMGMGFFTSMIHKWAPSARIKHIDTVFRAPVLADHKHTVQAVVTDIDEDSGDIVLDLTIKNDQEETRVFGTATVELPLDSPR